MNTCPACSQPLPVERALMCVSGRCEPEPDAPPGVSGPVRTVTPVAGPGRPAPPAWPTLCPECDGVEEEVCVRADCRFPLPPGWRETGGTVVALAGARATGKSIYIAVLVHQLQQYGELIGMKVVPATSRTAESYREVYEEPLYEQRGMLSPTTRVSEEQSRERDPLVYELSPTGGRRHFLVLRDVSGEDLAQSAPDVRRLGWFATADIVLFLFDPLALPDVRAMLAGLVPHQARPPADDPRVALDNVLRMVAPGRRPRLGVVLSKFDVLQAVRDVRGAGLARIMQNSGAAFCREPSWRGPYDEQDGELLHEEVRSLLRWLGVSSLVTDMDLFTAEHAVEHRFFAVSALGDPPDGSYLHARGIAPFRCLDPVRWALAGRRA